MMMATARVQGRIDPRLKIAAEGVIKKNGFTVSQVLTVIYSYIATKQELPIEVKKIPNAVTKKAMRDLDSGKGIVFNTAEEAFKDLGLM